MNKSTEQRHPPIDTLGVGTQNTARAQRDHSFSKPAHQNIELVGLNPSSDMPPPTTLEWSCRSGTPST